MCPNSLTEPSDLIAKLVRALERYSKGPRFKSGSSHTFFTPNALPPLGRLSKTGLADFAAKYDWSSEKLSKLRFIFAET